MNKLEESINCFFPHSDSENSIRKVMLPKNKTEQRENRPTGTISPTVIRRQNCNNEENLFKMHSFTNSHHLSNGESPLKRISDANGNISGFNQTFNLNKSFDASKFFKSSLSEQNLAKQQIFKHRYASEPHRPQPPPNVTVFQPPASQGLYNIDHFTKMLSSQLLNQQFNTRPNLPSMPFPIPTSTDTLNNNLPSNMPLNPIVIGYHPFASALFNPWLLPHYLAAMAKMQEMQALENKSVSFSTTSPTTFIKQTSSSPSPKHTTTPSNFKNWLSSHHHQPLQNKPSSPTHTICHAPSSSDNSKFPPWSDDANTRRDFLKGLRRARSPILSTDHPPQKTSKLSFKETPTKKAKTDSPNHFRNSNRDGIKSIENMLNCLSNPHFIEKSEP